MKKILFCLIIVAIGFCSCSPRVHKHIIKEMHPAPNDSEVTVYNIGEIVPENAEVIGNVSVLDGGFTTKCDWTTVIETAKQEVRAAGGNGIEILQHSFPGQNGSGCHQIIAYILNIDDEIEPIELSESAKESFLDYVVMKDGDTIPCRITNNTNNGISFIYERNGVRRFSRLAKSDLRTYYINDPVELAQRKAESEKEEYHVQIALSGGYAFRTARFSSDISADYKDYLRKLSHGPDFGASLRINLTDGFTLGLHYDRFSKSLQAIGYIYDDEGNYNEGNISNTHTITFIGASFGALSSYSHNRKHFLCIDLLAGYLGYEDNAEEFGLSYKLTGKTLGYGVGFGYDYKITKHIAIGAEFAYIKGALKEVLYDNGITKRAIDLGNSKEGLQRINLKAGVRFYL